MDTTSKPLLSGNTPNSSSFQDAESDILMEETKTKQQSEELNQSKGVTIDVEHIAPQEEKKEDKKEEDKPIGPKSANSLIDFSKLKPCPETKANPISKLTFQWLDSLVWLGSRKTLGFEDLYNLRKEETAKDLSEKFQKNLYTHDNQFVLDALSYICNLHFV